MNDYGDKHLSNFESMSVTAPMSAMTLSSTTGPTRYNVVKLPTFYYVDSSIPVRQIGVGYSIYIDHSILAEKLKMYGLDENSQNFMNNYMYCRKQSTIVNGSCSPQ